ncbi:hypothetical protein TNCV_43101 [Trichonephila clavipes]|nr:hypothetical protein TNCV_43101 [Trichonephila clavipes]
MIPLLWAKNVPASAMGRLRVAKLYHSFQPGRQDAEIFNVTRSSQPSSSMTESTTAQIGEMIQNDRQISLREISSKVRLSHGSVQHIIPDVLRYPKTML